MNSSFLTTETRAYLDRVSALASELLQLGAAAGMTPRETRAFASDIARKSGLRAWDRVRTAGDYETVIAAMQRAIDNGDTAA